MKIRPHASRVRHGLEPQVFVRAFITGITGFAGSHLAEHLLACGDQVLGCSRQGTWKARGLPAELSAIRVLAWDVSSALASPAVQSLAEFGPEVIYHLAAISVPRDCGTYDPTDRARAINVAGTRSVLDVASRLPRPPRVVVVSSSHVYGPGDPAHPLVREDAPAAPSSAYGKTKLAAEQETLWAVARGNVDAVIARTFNHAGPRQDPRLMLAEWCRQMIGKTDQPVRVLNLDTYLDLSDVRDVVCAYRLLASYGDRGAVYNIGCGRSYRTGDLFERLRELTGCDQPFVELSPGLRQQPIADTTRLQRLTGWRPEIAIDKTLSDELAYWKATARDAGR